MVIIQRSHPINPDIHYIFRFHRCFSDHKLRESVSLFLKHIKDVNERTSESAYYYTLPGSTKCNKYIKYTISGKVIIVDILKTEYWYQYLSNMLRKSDSYLLPSKYDLMQFLQEAPTC